MAVGVVVAPARRQGYESDESRPGRRSLAIWVRRHAASGLGADGKQGGPRGLQRLGEAIIKRGGHAVSRRSRWSSPLSRRPDIMTGRRAAYRGERAKSAQ